MNNDQLAEFAASYPSSELLARLAPKTVASMYIDVIDAYEFKKSEDCRSAAGAVFGGPIKVLEYVLVEELGLDLAELTVDDKGHPTSPKLEELQDAYYERMRGGW